MKHWHLDHPELREPPKFKFKIISSFQDPLTRQLAESVRIERRGASNLNSKSEYSRCRVPHLRVDMEGWRRADDANVDTKERQAKDQDDMDKVEELSAEIRREESKRKGEESKGRRRKRRKLSRLVG